MPPSPVTSSGSRFLRILLSGMVNVPWGRPPQLARHPPGRERGDHPFGRRDPPYRPDSRAEVAVCRDDHGGVVPVARRVLDQGDRDAHVGLLLLVRDPPVAAGPALQMLLLEPSFDDAQQRARSLEGVEVAGLPVAARCLAHPGAEVADPDQLLVR
jgi:hypothetical protein